MTEKKKKKLPGKVNPNPHGARPVHLMITMIKWTRTSRLSIQNSLSDPPPHHPSRAGTRSRRRKREGLSSRKPQPPPKLTLTLTRSHAHTLTRSGGGHDLESETRHPKPSHHLENPKPCHGVLLSLCFPHHEPRNPKTQAWNPKTETRIPESKPPTLKPQTPNSKPQTPNPQNPKPNTKHQTSNPKPQTPNPKPPDPKPQTPNPKLQSRALLRAHSPSDIELSLISMPDEGVWSANMVPPQP